MPTYKFSQRSSADLENIVSYTLGNWGSKQAISYIDGLKNLTQSLTDAPSLGKLYNDRHTGLHGFVYESHIIYYIEAEHGITIVRVLHQRMNPLLHL